MVILNCLFMYFVFNGLYISQSKRCAYELAQKKIMADTMGDKPPRYKIDDYTTTMPPPPTLPPPPSPPPMKIMSTNSHTSHAHRSSRFTKIRSTNQQISEQTNQNDNLNSRTAQQCSITQTILTVSHPLYYVKHSVKFAHDYYIHVQMTATVKAAYSQRMIRNQITSYQYLTPRVHSTGDRHPRRSKGHHSSLPTPHETHTTLPRTHAPLVVHSSLMIISSHGYRVHASLKMYTRALKILQV